MQIALGLILFLLFFQTRASVERVAFGLDEGSKYLLDGFIYSPKVSQPKGVIIVAGGSGFSKAGFSGPSAVSKVNAEMGFVSFEWNKRGIITNDSLDEVTVDPIYREADIEAIYRDALAGALFMKKLYPEQDVYLLGGSEGSIIVTLLAQRNPELFKGVATFGTVAATSDEQLRHQLSHTVVDKFWNDFDNDGDNLLSHKEFDQVPDDHSDWNAPKKKGFYQIDRDFDDFISRDELSTVVVEHFLSDEMTEHRFEKVGLSPNYFNSLEEISPLYTRISDIRVPTLFMHGEEDWNTPVRFVRKLQGIVEDEGLNGFEFRYYEGVGHSPSREMVLDYLRFFQSL